MSDTQELTPFGAFRQEFSAQRKSIEAVLPPGVEIERFMRTTLTAVQAKPDLLFADRKTLMLSCIAAARDGLLPDGREAALNVYSTKVKVWSERMQRDVEEYIQAVQYLPMVRGIVKIMYECGVRHITARAVYREDHFRFLSGDDERIEHEPTEANDPGPIRAAYAIFTMGNGEIHREVMWARDIDKVRLCAKTQGVWTKWPDQMAIKSVIKRAAKLLPWDADALERVMHVIQSDNTAMGYDNEDDDAPATAQETPQYKQAATPALNDNRAQQQANTVVRPSRMASIMQQRQQATQAQVAQATQAGPDEPIPWEDGQ